MKAILHNILYLTVSALLSIGVLFGANGDCLKVDSADWNTNYPYVFVHGLSGWGSYDPVNRLLPYWGMFGGDLMKYLNSKGFHACSASVDPIGSAWDRACELYAQLTGSRVDYGKAHSARCGHERFGTDFSGRALVPAFSETEKINLLGHSFGGATIRMFAGVMETGSEAERAATPQADLSPYFAGGKGNWIHSITTLAAPHNGTTSYDAPEVPPPNALQQTMTALMEQFTNRKRDDRIEEDYADFDLHVDGALALNETLQTSDSLYYFSFACSATTKQQSGVHAVDPAVTEPLFRASGNRIGQFTGETKGGYPIDESWLENDGLVNTISAEAPFGAPRKTFDEEDVPRGVWNVMPIVRGDHMSLQGGFFLTNDVKPLYTEHLSRINRLP